MKKKMLAAILAACILAELLSGCGGNESGGQEEPEDTGPATQGEMLEMVCDTFGISSCEEGVESPVPESDPYYEVARQCAAWDIIDSEGDYDTASEVTWGDLAVAAVNAAVPNSTEMDREEKLAIAEEMGLLEGEEDEPVMEEEVREVLEKAQQTWAEPEYEPSMDYTLQDNVKDYSAGAGLCVYDEGSGNTLMDADNAAGLQPGDIYLVRDQYGLTSAHRVGQIEEQNGRFLVTNQAREPTLEEVFEEVAFQTTETLNLSAGRIEDGNGTVLTGGTQATNLDAAADEAPQANFLGGAEAGGSATPLSLGSKSIDFKVGSDVTVKGKVDGSSVSFKVEYTVGDGLKLSQAYEISDFKFSGDIDYGVFRGLKYARLQLDYETKSTTTFKTKAVDLSGYSYDVGGEGYQQRLDNLLKIAASALSGKGLTYDGKDAGGAQKSIRIARFNTPLSIGLAGIAIEIDLEFTMNGSVELVISTDMTTGIEYKKGSGIRAIKKKDVDKDLNLEAKAEGLLYLGVVADAAGFNLADVGAKAGVGVTFGSTIHLADYTVAGELAIERAKSSNDLTGDVMNVASQIQLEGTLKAEACSYGKLYFILRLTAGTNSLLGELVTLEEEIFGEDNAVLLEFHLEDGGFVDECTRKYRTEEEEEEETEEEQEDTAEEDSDNIRLDLSTYSITLSGEAQRLELEIKMPGGEAEPAVVWTSDNPNVATVDSSGLVSPVGTGFTTITVSLRDDPSVYVKCAVNVEEIGEENWQFLPADMSYQI